MYPRNAPTRSSSESPIGVNAADTAFTPGNSRCRTSLMQYGIRQVPFDWLESPNAGRRSGAGPFVPVEAVTELLVAFLDLLHPAARLFLRVVEDVIHLVVRLVGPGGRLCPDVIEPGVQFGQFVLQLGLSERRLDPQFIAVLLQLLHQFVDLLAPGCHGCILVVRRLKGQGSRVPAAVLQDTVTRDLRTTPAQMSVIPAIGSPVPTASRECFGPSSLRSIPCDGCQIPRRSFRHAHELDEIRLD